MIGLLIYSGITLLLWIIVYLIAVEEEKSKFPFSGIWEMTGIMFVISLWPVLILVGVKEGLVGLYNIYKKRRQRLTDLRVMIEQRYEWYD